jgi:alcohol dehydrogenase (NADP+)
VESILRDTLAKLDLSYLDLYLMHWPVAQTKNAARNTVVDLPLTLDHLPTWRAMEALVAKGLGMFIFIVLKIEELKN